MAKVKMGRPTAMTPDVIRKLEEVFSIGGTDKEACFNADIAMSTLYKYQESNPYFVERKEALKINPTLIARRSVIAGLDDPDRALRYLERKAKDEFSPRQENTGANGGPMEIRKVEDADIEDAINGL